MFTSGLLGYVRLEALFVFQYHVLLVTTAFKYFKYSLAQDFRGQELRAILSTSVDVRYYQNHKCQHFVNKLPKL